MRCRAARVRVARSTAVEWSSPQKSRCALTRGMLHALADRLEPEVPTARPGRRGRTDGHRHRRAERQSVDVLPEFTPPYVEIQTEALGLSADEVEQLITVPLEADLLNGIDGRRRRSARQSVPGLSSIVLVFEPGTDPYRGRAARAGAAHAGASRCRTSPSRRACSSRSPPTSRVLMIGLSVGAKPLTAIEQVRARALDDPAAPAGRQGRRERGDLGPARPAAAGPGRPAPPARPKRDARARSIRTAGNAQIVSPLTLPRGVDARHRRVHRDAAPASAGPPHLRPARRRRRRSRACRSRARAASCASATCRGSSEDHQPLIGDAVVDGGDGLMLVVEKLPGASTLEVTRGVEDALDELRPGLAGMKIDTDAFRPATFVEDATHNLTARRSSSAVLLLALAAGGAAGALAHGASSPSSRSRSPSSPARSCSISSAPTMNALSFAGLAARASRSSWTTP